MLPLQPPINADSNKEIIANLHEALAFLEMKVDAAEIQNKQYGDTTRRLIIVFQRKLKLQETDGFAGENTAAKLNEMLKEKGAFTEENNFKVSGRVFTNSGVQVPGVKVMAYDKQLDSDMLLGETIADRQGKYLILYKKFSDGKENPDIEIRVMDNRDVKKEIARSAIKYNAGASEIIDVIVMSDNLQQVPEFERLLKDLQPHLGKIQLKDIEETKEKQQVTHLSNKTGWDARLVAMVSQAHKLSAQTKVDPSHFYALFRAGLPGNSAALAALTPTLVETVIKKAGETNIISPVTNTEQTIKLVKEQTTQFLLKVIPAASVSSMSTMLDLRLNTNQKKIFTDTFEEAGNNDTAKFWSTLKNRGIDENTIDRLKLDGKLGFLTGQNAPLVKKIHDKYQVSNEVELVQKGLYKPDEWKTIIGNDLPKDVTADEYATQLAYQLKLSYPTAVAAEMVNRNEIKLGENTPRQEVYKFLSADPVKNIIGKQPVKTWPGFAQLTEPSKVAAKTMERLYQMSPSDESMVALSGLGLTSAYQIASFTKGEFIQKYSGQFPNVQEAELTYTKASEVHSAAMSLATTYLTYRAMPNIYAISGKQQKVQNEIIAYPTLEELFGNMDYCACEHCKSVLSPAAYLVDLLQFIDLANIPHDKQNPITELFKRRHDIQHIQLTCENTNMALPYIDLVNEILEHYLIHGNLTTLTGHDITEETKQTDLLAEPQFVSETAYNELKTKVYPYNLPFHYPLEALRLLFNMWDTSLEEVMYIFSTPLASRKEILGLNEDEYKTLTDRTFRELPEYFGEAPATNIAVLNTLIADGKSFSRRVDISYEELVQLLKTKFINPGIVLVPLLQKLEISLADLQAYYNGAITDAQMDTKIPAAINAADFEGDVKQWLKNNEKLIMGLITLTDVGPETSECNFAAVHLRYALPDNNNNNLTAFSYHKFHRFIRLLKSTGWKIETLDEILRVFSPMVSQNIDENNIDGIFVTLLSRIANFKKIAAHLSLSSKKLKDLLLLWDASKDQSLREEQCARFLKIRIADLKDLSEMTGIDPLANDLENDEPSFLKFIYVAKELKNVSLKVADLNYILRHKDESGKLTPSEDSLLKNIKQLRDALTIVEKENGIAPDNADFAFAKSKMALVYDASVTEIFFGLLTATKTYTANWNIIEEGLPIKLGNADANLGFDPFKKILTYRGVVSAAIKTNLDSIADSLVLGDMGVITIQNDLNTFINDFKTALQQIANDGNADLQLFSASYPELKIIYDAVKAEANPAGQTKLLLNGILPELKTKLKTNSLRQILASLLKTEIETVNALTGKKEVVQSSADNTKTVLFDFNQLEEKIVFDLNQIYQFYLDVPATDDYLVYITSPQNTTITLTVNGQNIINNAVVGASGEVKNNLPLNLKTGSLHFCELSIGGLPVNSQVQISWRTKGMAKVIVPAANIYRKENVDAAGNSFIRLQKAVHLQQLLKLTPRELVHFASQNSETQSILNDLDTNGTITVPNQQALWDKLKKIIFFAGLKKENEPEENVWVQILENPDVKTQQNKNLLEGINFWKETDLAQVLNHFGLVRSDLSKLSVLKKVIAAMQLVTTITYPASSILMWITPHPAFSLITDIKKTIKDNITEAAWLETMPTVSDPLRNKLRDALVSYILHYKKPSAEINTPDKLYEYFLVDVEMDACMKTSRIRLALSTVQLFIQRCLMNLEPDVAPSSIRTHQWLWMKRYRVWEANRKVFLYPENWLEPELRDNKSSFFKELEGELLQSEITDDSAELAFLNYLKKLDDVARLDIAGMYLEENEQGNQDDDILHVFGRTNGSTRQYFYRRYEYGYWTPWEKMSLNVEGEHIYPVVWKKRLFLFWLNIFEKPADVPNSSPKTIGDSPWKNNAKINVEISMSWGEYYKGKWTSPKSTEITQPLRINNLTAFRPANILLYAKKVKPQNKSERLIFNLYYVGEGVGLKAFNITYTSKNSPPVIEQDKSDDDLAKNVALFNYTLYRSGYTGSAESFLNYNGLFTTGKELKNMIVQPQNAASAVVTEKLITKKDILFGGFRLLPMRHKAENQWETPFIYADERSTFFVQPDEEVFIPLWRYDGYYHVGIYKQPAFTERIEIPVLIEETIPGWPPIQEKMPGIEEIINDPWKLNEKTVIKNTNINKVLPVANNFVFGNTVFGTGGKVPDSLIDKFKTNDSNF